MNNFFRILLPCIFAFTLGFLQGCNTVQERASRSVDTTGLNAIDYHIISDALEQFVYGPKDPSENDLSNRKKVNLKLFINDSTQTPRGSDLHFQTEMSTHEDSVFKNLAIRFSEVNRKKYELDSSKISSFDVHLLTRMEIRELIGIDYGYQKFYDRYPNAYGIISLSRPVFDEKEERAMIYIVLVKDTKWGQGNQLWLRKEKGKWKVCKEVLLWVS